MTEQIPSSTSSRLSPTASVTSPTPARRNVVQWFYALGFLILAAAIIYLWQYPSTLGENTRRGIRPPSA